MANLENYCNKVLFLQFPQLKKLTTRVVSIAQHVRQVCLVYAHTIKARKTITKCMQSINLSTPTYLSAGGRSENQGGGNISMCITSSFDGKGFAAKSVKTLGEGGGNAPLPPWLHRPCTFRGMQRVRLPLIHIVLKTQLIVQKTIFFCYDF